jgi:hypothetical protein
MQALKFISGMSSFAECKNIQICCLQLLVLRMLQPKLPTSRLKLHKTRLYPARFFRGYKINKIISKFVA